ncbi:deoxyribonuclease V [Cytophagaceae bacterium DM2B3-1]|uniref:Endonuclease V n=1 Tax=Xanthocytophaga flava TaxID=3048013 RepID=A0ABT7CSG1_9BACT|nr:deoxyribonuclease V [Xanthocytophaga flavus]MDJ1496616.1 deoxyribonuclease V [Xanthocytophaga flavus]
MSIANHSWDLSIPEAIALQKELRTQIQLTRLDKEIRYVAGTDISFNKFSDTVYAGIVVLDLTTLQEVARSIVVTETHFPYVPGLLSFREIPALLQAWEQLTFKPDLLIVDGHGIAHPRRLGIATHLGLALDMPTIGCGKSRLTGTYTLPDNEPGSTSPLWDRQDQIGIVLRSKRNTLPLFISPGHKITFAESVTIVQKCITKYRLPETTRKVHDAVNALRIAYKGPASPA